jgi:hypothetical protein
MLYIDTRHSADCDHADNMQWRRHGCSRFVQPRAVGMAEGMPTDASVLSGSVPSLIVQR